MIPHAHFSAALSCHGSMYYRNGVPADATEIKIMLRADSARAEASSSGLRGPCADEAAGSQPCRHLPNTRTHGETTPAAHSGHRRHVPFSITGRSVQGFILVTRPHIMSLWSNRRPSDVSEACLGPSQSGGGLQTFCHTCYRPVVCTGLGLVEECGAEATRFQPGQRVVCVPSQAWSALDGSGTWQQVQQPLLLPAWLCLRRACALPAPLFAFSMITRTPYTKLLSISRYKYRVFLPCNSMGRSSLCVLTMLRTRVASIDQMKLCFADDDGTGNQPIPCA